MSNKAAGQVIAQLTETLLNAMDQVEKEKTELQAFVNNVVPGFKSGEITADRIQILENGDIRILPVPPTPNGTGPVTDTPPLTEPKNEDEPKENDQEIRRVAVGCGGSEDESEALSA